MWTYFAKATDADGDMIAYSLDAASIARGMSIDATSGRIDWTAASAGSFNTTITAQDGRGGLATQSITIAVSIANAAPRFTSTPAGIASVGLTWSYTLAATDANDAPATLAYSLVAPTLPSPGVQFDPATQTLSWTPESTAPQSFTLRVTDPQGAIDQQSFTLTPGTPPPANQPPVIRSSAPTSIQLGESYSYPVNAFDPDGDALTYSLATGMFPAGMAIDRATGQVSWTPSSVGSFAVTLQVADPIHPAVAQSFTLDVLRPVATNAPPEITSNPTGPAIRNRVWTYPITTSDPNGDAVTLTLQSGPTGASIDPVTGRLTWTPTAAGAFDFVIAATDVPTATGVTPRSVTQSFSLTVVPNSPPTITTTTLPGGTLGAAYSHTVLAVDPEADPIRFTLDADSIGRGVAIHPDTGTLSWANPTTGSFTLVVTAADPQDARTTRDGLTLRVVDNVSPNSPPQILSNVTGGIQLGQTFLHQLQTFDPDGDPLSYTLTAAPAGMTIDAAGLIRWTPASGQLGNQSFTTQVTDNRPGGTVSKTFTLQVVSSPVNGGGNPTNQPPTFTSNPGSTAVVGSVYAYNATATDPDGDTLAFSVAAGPAGLTIHPATGQVRWTPTAAQVGPHDVSFRVTDARGASTVQNGRLSVTATNRPPVISSDPPTRITAGQTLQYQLVASDPDGHALTYTLAAATTAPGASISSAGLLSWITSTADIGVNPLRRVQINVVDSLGLGVAQIFDIEVVSATSPQSNRPPRITTTSPLQRAAADA